MVAGPHAIAQLLFQGLPGQGVVGNGAADLLLDRLHRRRAVACHHLGGLESPRHQSLGGHDAIDQSEPRRLRRIDQPGGEQEIHGVDVTDLLDELHGGAAEGVDGPAHLREAEAGMGGRRPDIGGEQELQAAADTVAVDGGDDGLGVGALLEERVADNAGRLGSGGEIAAQVGPGAEGAVTGAGEHDAAAARALEPVPELGQLRHHGARHGVPSRLVVDGDDHDVRPVLLGA